MEIRPQEAAKQLLKNAHEIAEMTDKIIEARNAQMLAEAKLLDAKAECRKVAQGLSATATEQFVNQNTVAEKKECLRADATLRSLQDKLNVLETGNANYKMAIRLMIMEVQNLSLE